MLYLTANGSGTCNGLVNVDILSETSVLRVLAVGDVRSHSVKRVASASGEVGVAVQLIHRALSE
jgi:thioredoxin reductase